MNRKTKTTLIQLAGLLLCLVCACVGIFWHMAKTNETSDIPDPPSAAAPENQLTADTKTEYDPVAHIENVVINDEPEIKSYDYYEYAKNYNMQSALKSKGYKLTEKSYDPSDCKVGVLSIKIKLPTELSQTKRKVQKPVIKETYHGYVSENETVTEDCPVLVPYYGYVIYTAKGVCKLLDSELNTLMGNFSGFTPAYMTDYAGNPLFEKDGRYYFYYDGRNYNGTVYTSVENDTFSKLPVTAPEAYEYFNYDVDMLHNLFVTNDFTNEANMRGIAYILPEHSGMVEFSVDEDLLFDLRIPSATNNKSNGKLFRFPSYTYTKKEEKQIDGNPYYSYEVTEILWGYMDAKGNVVVEPKYHKAYEFSEDGFAVVSDKDGHLSVLNEWGSVVYNYYNDSYEFTDLGIRYARDGHFLPDTFGVESTGMLYFDRGFIRMRRKLVDVENGYIDKRDYSTLVDTEGKTLNIPLDCTIEGYGDGVALIKRGDKYGYMRSDGSWLIEPELAYAKPFSEGLAVMGYAKDKLGVIDTEGNIVLYPMYSHIESSSGGVITAYSPVGGWNVFNKMSTNIENETENPIIALKKRAIAEARDKYYNQEKEEVKEDELSGGQG
ncbi:MAG: WG repeat-containing protein [Clostridia bacterium]|nr:WG repeat-containing protein [Clostridia bacterium]